MRRLCRLAPLSADRSKATFPQPMKRAGSSSQDALRTASRHKKTQRPTETSMKFATHFRKLALAAVALAGIAASTTAAAGNFTATYSAGLTTYSIKGTEP